MLEPAELKRRIAAARTLRGVTQEELQAQLAEEGLGQRELGRIERGGLPLTRVRRVALAEALGVPEAWFLEESVDLIVGVGPGPQEQLEAIDGRITQLFEKLDQVRVEQGTRVLEVLKRVDALEGTILQSQRQRPA